MDLRWLFDDRTVTVGFGPVALTFGGRGSGLLGFIPTIGWHIIPEPPPPPPPSPAPRSQRSVPDNDEDNILNTIADFLGNVNDTEISERSLFDICDKIAGFIFPKIRLRDRLKSRKGLANYYQHQVAQQPITVNVFQQTGQQATLNDLQHVGQQAFVDGMQQGQQALLNNLQQVGQQAFVDGMQQGQQALLNNLQQVGQQAIVNGMQQVGQQALFNNLQQVGQQAILNDLHQGVVDVPNLPVIQQGGQHSIVETLLNVVQPASQMSSGN